MAYFNILPATRAFVLFFLLLCLLSAVVAQDADPATPTVPTKGGPDKFSDPSTQPAASDDRKALRSKIWSFHGLTMSTAFLVLYPAGYIVIRSPFGNSPQGSFRGHLIVQSSASAFLLCGLGFGLLLSKGISRSHQIIGLLVTVGIIVQATVGYLHHRQYVRTNTRSRYSDVHAWLGRVVLLAGWINGLLGLKLAEAETGLFIGFIVFAAVDAVLLSMVWVIWKRNAGARRQQETSKDEQALLADSGEAFALTGDDEEGDSSSEDGKTDPIKTRK